jgi:hypothetical protein
MPHDGRRREPLATAPPQSSLSVTVELSLMGRCFVECVLINLLIERYCVGSKNAVFWDVSKAVTILNACVISEKAFIIVTAVETFQKTAFFAST